MKLRWAVGTVLVLGCLLVDAGSAAGRFTVRGRQLTRIELQGTDGYSVLIVSDRKQHLILTTTKEAFTTEYVTRDRSADPGRIKAALPGVGTISVRFHPDGPAHRGPAFAGCIGPRPKTQRGVVRGVIDFAGERKYTQVKTHEAPAKIEEWRRQRCRFGAGPEPFTRNLTDWISKFSVGTLGVEFLARKYRPGILEGGNRILYSAIIGEEASPPPARLAVFRHAVVEGPATAFDAHPEHMTISPPPPFTGTGTLARTPESVFTWEGDLSIQFPGVDALSLTDPEWESDYCRRKVGCFRQRVEPSG